MLTTSSTCQVTISQAYINSGTASAISIGSGTVVGVWSSTIVSSNTNAITGAGTIQYGGIAFAGSSQTINTTTQTPAGTLKGSTTTAPTAGYLGEQILSSVTAVATTNGTAKSITSISLTPGIWDISALTYPIATGAAAVMIAAQTGIGTTLNTLTGTAGIDFIQINAPGQVLGLYIGQYRVTLSATTTYYLNVINSYSATTCPTNGTIRATRVG